MSEVLKDFSANIDLKETLVFEPIKVVEGDNGNVLVLNIVKDGEPVDLTDCLVQIVFAHSGRTVWQDSSSPTGGITISGDDNNIVTVRLHSDSYAPNGITVCQVQVYSGTSNTTLVSSSRFSFKAELSLLNAETVESIEQYSILVTLIESVNSVLDGAQSDWNETDQLLKSYIRNKPVIGTDIQAATQNLAAETVLADADAFAGFKSAGSAHRKWSWLSIKSAIKTFLFGAVTGLAKIDGAGNVSAAVANTDYAAASHAARHAVGGGDAITPGNIGAAPATHASKHATGGSDPIPPSTIGAASLDAANKVLANQASAKTVSLVAPINLTTDHAGKHILVNATSSITISMPANASVAYPIDTEIEFTDWMWVSGRMTIAPGAGVTIRWADGSSGSKTSSNVGATCVLKKLEENVWLGAGL